LFLSKEPLIMSGLGSFRIIPDFGAWWEAAFGEPRMNARFFGVGLLKGKGLAVFDRSCVRGFGRQWAGSSSLPSTGI
jgi:hypothetical protein